MTLIREKIEEIDAQAAACDIDGSALREWQSAREIDIEEVHECIHEIFPDGEITMSPCGFGMMCFRWGYEVAMAKALGDIL